MTLGNSGEIPPPGRKVLGLPGRKELGLPDRSVIVRVLHNRASGITIVELETHQGSPLHRLYWRRATESGYRIVGDPAANESLEDAVTGEQPTLFWNVIKLKQTARGIGGTWLGVWSANLADSGGAPS